MELVRAPMVLLFQSRASRIAIFYSDNLFRLAPNSKMVIYLFMPDFSHFVPACCFLSLRGHFAIGFSLFVFRSASYEKRLQNTRMFNFNFDSCLQYEPLTCLKSFSSLLFRLLITAFSYPSTKICYTSLVAGVHFLSTLFLYAYQSGKSPFQIRKRMCKC